MNLVKQTLTDEFGVDIKRNANDVSLLCSQLSSSPTTMTVVTTGNSQSLTPSSVLSNQSTEAKMNSFFNYTTISEQIATSLFELYNTMNEIYKLRIYVTNSDQATLRINSFYEFFYMPFKRWIDLIKRKIDSKAEKCFESEKSDVLTELTKFSSSSVEMCYCITQASSLWKVIDWPDHYGAKMYATELGECLCRACIRYATQVKENNANFINSLHQGTNNNNTKHTYISMLQLNINDIKQ